MRWKIIANGKKHRVGFWKFIAYHALYRVEKLENRIRSLENKLDKAFNQKSDNSNDGADSRSDETK